LDFLIQQMLEVLNERGSDMQAGLRIARHLETGGLAPSVTYYGQAVHGEDLRSGMAEALLPIFPACLKGRMPEEELAGLIRAAGEEMANPCTWLSFVRAVVLAQKPGACRPGSAP
jgi:hypothetical protein